MVDGGRPVGRWAANGPRTRWATIATLLLVPLAACTGDTAPAAGSDTTNSSLVETSVPAEPISTSPLPVTTLPPVDADAIVEASDFDRCPGLGEDRLAASLSQAERQDIVDRFFASGLGRSAGLGERGERVALSLRVLDEASLEELASVVDAADVCVEGGDPNDHVPSGAQQLAGPGWRWVGAGRIDHRVDRGTSAIVQTQDDYDELWSVLGEGPEVEQLEVDFEPELILVHVHGSGISFGDCGLRFDGYGIDDDVVVLDFVAPGGHQPCTGMADPAVYAVALEREFVGDIPFEAKVRFSPLADRIHLDLRVGLPTLTARRD